VEKKQTSGLSLYPGWQLSFFCSSRYERKTSCGFTFQHTPSDVFLSLGVLVVYIIKSVQECFNLLFHPNNLSDDHCVHICYTGWSKSLCAPDDYSTIHNWWVEDGHHTFGKWTVLYWTRSSGTQFGVSMNVWRLPGDTLNIVCNFPYCNHQVHRDFLITLYFTVCISTSFQILSSYFNPV
jgi:hypothetical protein